MDDRQGVRPAGRPQLAEGAPRAVRGLAPVVPLLLLAAALLRARRVRGVALLGAGAGLGALAFFRDPERTPTAPAEGGFIAAADGIVTRVEQLADGRMRVSTYMRLRDVHVNRAPVAGVVRSMTHRPGGHWPARSKDSDRNERLEWVLDTAAGPLELVQIAGALARRIVPYRTPGDPVERGARLGLIRFGSRVDVVLPAGTRVAVREGERVRAGVSRLAWENEA
jgi:phosphatidylserine decarboxylase